MLAYRLEGRTPPIDEWASSQYRVKYADEFKRPSSLQAEEQERLQGIYDGTAEVGRLRLNVNAQFGEYDAAGRVLPGCVHAGQRQFRRRSHRRRSRDSGSLFRSTIRGAQLGHWMLLGHRTYWTRNSGLRSVVLDSWSRSPAQVARSEGLVIKARLLGYTIGSDHYNRPATFGEVNSMVKGSAEMKWRAKGSLVGLTLLLSACGGGLAQLRRLDGPDPAALRAWRGGGAVIGSGWGRAADATRWTATAYACGIPTWKVQPWCSPVSTRTRCLDRWA